MKEHEIESRLNQGEEPKDLVKAGYSRGTVYKVSRRLKSENGVIPGAEDKNSVADVNLEEDSGIRELKKQIRLAQLQVELDRVKGIPSSASRLRAVEETLEELYSRVNDISDDLATTPLVGMRDKFRCQCGAKGYIAVRIVCTCCQRQSTYGWQCK